MRLDPCEIVTKTPKTRCF